MNVYEHAEKIITGAPFIYYGFIALYNITYVQYEHKHQLFPYNSRVIMLLLGRCNIYLYIKVYSFEHS